MKKRFPASETEMKTLSNPPEQSHCLLPKDQQTLQNLSDVIVYIWLKNGKGFWYHVQHWEKGVLYGYALFDGWWYYMPIPDKRIATYY